ncbi:carbohydrate sulfotransferase 14-like [Amphiura filiformis]|uniref:carbohydrate sulfotransferase 14-like n=1 Tax=Amphiura filiformis TaxID=82378 RepID=UPI003B21C614
MPRVSASRIAKLAAAIIILVLVLHYTINQEKPDETFPQVKNEEKPRPPAKIINDHHNEANMMKERKKSEGKQLKDNKKIVRKNLKISQEDLQGVQDAEKDLQDGNAEIQDEKTWTAKMDRRNAERKALLKKVCEERYNKHFKSWEQLAADPSNLRPLIVNDDHHFIYSIVYKVGSTNWERVIVQDLGGFKNVPNQKLYSHQALKWMPKFSPSEALQKLELYTKFIFSRDPLSRILSGYKDKFVDHHNAVFSKMAQFIVKNYRTDSNTSPNITFTEFVRYLVDKAGHRTNVHWKPIHKQNFPCEIEYDIIGRLEDAHEDIPYVLKRVGIYNLTDYGKGPPRKTSNDLIVKYYSQLPKDLLHTLYEIYEPDFTLFGYDMPETFTLDSS